MLNISLDYQVNFGQAIYLSGNSQTLGSWNPLQAQKMRWTQGNKWVTEVAIHDFEYKYFIAEFDEPKNLEWECGPNRTMKAKSTTNITDVWNHRKVLFQCYNPQHYTIFISGSSFDLGIFHKRITMKQKQDISYFRMLVNVLEDKEIYYQFHVQTKRNYSSSLQILNLYTTNIYYKNSIVCYCEGLCRIKKSIYQLDKHICYGYVPADQIDFNSLKQANLKTIIEFQNSPIQSTTPVKCDDFTYLQVNVHFIKDSALYKRLYNFITVLVQKYHSIYICNNSLSHLRRYLNAYEQLIQS